MPLCWLFASGSMPLTGRLAPAGLPGSTARSSAAGTACAFNCSAARSRPPSPVPGASWPAQVKQYGEGLRPHKAQLQVAVGLTKSFMTKAALAAVAKL